MENEIARTLGLEDIQDIAVSLSGIEIPNYAEETINVVEPDNQGEAGKTTKTSPEVKALKEKSLRANLETNIAITKQKGAEAGAKTEEAIQKRLITRQENIKLREQGTPVKAPKLNLNSKAMVSLLEETNTSLDELKNMSDEEILDYLDNKMSGKADVKPKGQARTAEPEMKTPFLDIEGAGDVAAINMEKAGKVIDPLVDVITALPIGKSVKALGRAGKAIVEGGKGVR